MPWLEPDGIDQAICVQIMFGIGKISSFTEHPVDAASGREGVRYRFEFRVTPKTQCLTCKHKDNHGLLRKEMKLKVVLKVARGPPEMMSVLDGGKGVMEKRT